MQRRGKLQNVQWLEVAYTQNTQNTQRAEGSAMSLPGLAATHPHAARPRAASGCAAAPRRAALSIQRSQRPGCGLGAPPGGSTAARPSPRPRSAEWPLPPAILQGQLTYETLLTCFPVAARVRCQEEVQQLVPLILPAVQSGLLNLHFARPAKISDMAYMHSRCGQGVLIAGRRAANPVSRVHGAERSSALYEPPGRPTG